MIASPVPAYACTSCASNSRCRACASSVSRCFRAQAQETCRFMVFCCWPQVMVTSISVASPQTGQRSSTVWSGEMIGKSVLSKEIRLPPVFVRRSDTILVLRLLLRVRAFPRPNRSLPVDDGLIPALLPAVGRVEINELFRVNAASSFLAVNLDLADGGRGEARSARRLVRRLLSVLFCSVMFRYVMFGFQAGSKLFPVWNHTGTKYPTPSAIFGYQSTFCRKNCLVVSVILESVIDVPIHNDDYAALERNDVTLRSQQPKIIVIAADTACNLLR